MPSNKRGLGRGFDSLIPTDLIETEFDPTAKAPPDKGQASGEAILQIEPGLIDPNPHQPRQIFDEDAIAGLSESIRIHGILQPLVATKNGDRFELIAGERRLRAAKLAELKTVPVIVRSFDEQQKLELALLENLQRQDLNPIEAATAYRKLVDQFNMTVVEIARRVGKDDSTISNSMRLLGLPLEAKRAVATGKISEGHGRQILAVPGIEKQLALLDLIIKNDWTVRQTESFARDFKAPSATKERSIQRSSSSNDLTRDLESYFGTKVSIHHTAKGGRLQIEFYSDEDLDRIYKAIKESRSN